MVVWTDHDINAGGRVPGARQAVVLLVIVVCEAWQLAQQARHLQVRPEPPESQKAAHCHEYHNTRQQTPQKWVSRGMHSENDEGRQQQGRIRMRT